MSVTVEIEPSLEPALKLLAAAADLTVESYLRRLAEQDVLNHDLDPRVQAPIRMAEPLRGKLGGLPEGALDPDVLYGEQ